MNYYPFIVRVGEQQVGTIGVIYAINGVLTMCFRGVSVNKNSIVFNTGWAYNDGATNCWALPYKIYGIKI